SSRTQPISGIKRLTRAPSIRLGTFEHTLCGRRVVRATSAYSLPRDVAAHVNFVAGVTRFPRYRSHRNGAPIVGVNLGASNNAPVVI
ncbi:hypothetical protein, partial [Vibrio parahaemolyticus]|uniref:hypothetical protein n=1 Tax=Vibrio parahaemolyticus TaxID=670 RepID=UPI001A8D4DFF